MCLSLYQPTSVKLKEGGALVNDNNKNDKKYFLWSVLTSIHKFTDIPSLVSHYKWFENTINMDGILHPVKLHQIDRFKSLSTNIFVNVFAYDDDSSVKWSYSAHHLRSQVKNYLTFPYTLFESILHSKSHLLSVYGNVR